MPHDSSPVPDAPRHNTLEHRARCRSAVNAGRRLGPWMTLKQVAAGYDWSINFMLVAVMGCLKSAGDTSMPRSRSWKAGRERTSRERFAPQVP